MNLSDDTFGTCQRKDLFPILPLEIIGAVVIFLAIWFINLGGNQGGGMVVPLAMVFF